MKLLTGIVKSAKTQSTAIVEVAITHKHPLYSKRYKTTKRYLVHDKLKVKEGDKVQISETKPISRRKRWAISKIIK